MLETVEGNKAFRDYIDDILTPWQKDLAKLEINESTADNTEDERPSYSQSIVNASKCPF